MGMGTGMGMGDEDDDGDGVGFLGADSPGFPCRLRKRFADSDNATGNSGTLLASS